MIDFSTLSRQEAEEYCQGYVAAIPDQVRWLREEMARTGGPVEALDAPAQPADPASATYSAVIGVVVHDQPVVPDRLRRYVQTITTP